MAETEYGSRVESDDSVERKLEDSRLEVLRLRDLLIGRDAELGALKGRIAELEEREARMLTAMHRILKVPVLVRLALAALVRLGRRRDRPDD